MYHRPSGLTFDAALRDIQSAKPRARVAAAEILGTARDEDEKSAAFEALSAAIGDPRPEVRSTACFALSEIEREDAWEALALCLTDSVAEVRQSAAIALGSLAAPASFEALAQALREGPADLRFQAATSLVEVDAEAAYQPLVDALDDGDPEVLGAVALSLGAIGNAACADPIAELLDHASQQTRLDAAYGLAQLGDPRARETLAAALSDTEGGWDAVIALKELGSSSMPALAEFLEGARGEPRVRILAAGALISMASEEEKSTAARQCLLEALRSRKVELRGLAIQMLERHGNSWARQALSKLRTSFRGRRQVDEIDAALASIAERESN